MRTLFSEKFKPISFGENVLPDDEKMEFIYDSSENPNKAMCLGIARSLRIESSSAMRISRLTEVIDLKLTLIQLEKKAMNDKTQSVNDIVKNGAENELTEDQVIIAIVQSGVSYRDALGAYEKAAIDLGFKVKPMKPAERDAAVIKALGKKFKAPKDFDSVLATINKLMEKLSEKGLTATGAMTSIRKYCRDNEMDFPKRPKEAKVRINIATKATNFILDNIEIEDEKEAEKAWVEFCDENKIGPARRKVFADVRTAILARADADDVDEDEEDNE